MQEFLINNWFSILTLALAAFAYFQKRDVSDITHSNDIAVLKAQTAEINDLVKSVLQSMSTQRESVHRIDVEHSARMVNLERRVEASEVALRQMLDRMLDNQAKSLVVWERIANLLEKH